MLKIVIPFNDVFIVCWTVHWTSCQDEALWNPGFIEVTKRVMFALLCPRYKTGSQERDAVQEVYVWGSPREWK